MGKRDTSRDPKGFKNLLSKFKWLWDLIQAIPGSDVALTTICFTASLNRCRIGPNRSAALGIHDLGSDHQPALERVEGLFGALWRLTVPGTPFEASQPGLRLRESAGSGADRRISGRVDILKLRQSQSPFGTGRAVVFELHQTGKQRLNRGRNVSS